MIHLDCGPAVVTSRGQGSQNNKMGRHSLVPSWAWVKNRMNFGEFRASDIFRQKKRSKYKQNKQCSEVHLASNFDSISSRIDLMCRRPRPCCPAVVAAPGMLSKSQAVTYCATLKWESPVEL